MPSMSEDAATSRVPPRLLPSDTAFFLCDQQERLESLILGAPQTLAVGRALVTAAKIWQLPVLVTEQYPKAFRRTVASVGVRENSPGGEGNSGEGNGRGAASDQQGRPAADNITICEKTVVTTGGTFWDSSFLCMNSVWSTFSFR